MATKTHQTSERAWSRHSGNTAAVWTTTWSWVSTTMKGGPDRRSLIRNHKQLNGGAVPLLVMYNVTPGPATGPAVALRGLNGTNWSRLWRLCGTLPRSSFWRFWVKISKLNYQFVLHVANSPSQYTCDKITQLQQSDDAFFLALKHPSWCYLAKTKPYTNSVDCSGLDHPPRNVRNNCADDRIDLTIRQ